MHKRLYVEKNIPQLVSALTAFLTDREKSLRFGEAGRRQILNELTLENAITQIKDVYEYCIK